MNPRLLIELLCPPSCIACRKLLKPSLHGEAVDFCRDCGEAWEREAVSECPECFQHLTKCRCVPRLMKKAKISVHIKLRAYGEGSAHRTTRGVIQTMKHSGIRRAFWRLAKDLAEEVKAAVASAEEQEKSETHPAAVITFLPRSVEAKNKYGYDQAERLAKALAAETGLRFMPLLTRRRRSEQQKMLTPKERVENVKDAFVLSDNVAGLRVLLVDDVVTTGAGMAEAAGLLYGAGAVDVIAVSAAYTVKKQKNEN